MILSIVLLLIGFVILIYGADKLVDAASGLAANFGIPNIVIGLTVVAFGTSAPELVVNVFAAASGSSEMVMGNVLGSNIFNVLGILGISAIVYPLTVKSNTTWIEIPLSFLAALVVLIVANDFLFNDGANNLISFGDGIILLLFFSIFLVYNIMVSKQPGGISDSLEISKFTTGSAVLWIIIGLAGLVLGGKLIVDNAVSLAVEFGLSQRLIGLTIVSIGTSLPELATSIAAVKKKKVDIAIGNVVGSNIFNIFFVLGISSIVNPVSISEPNFIDIYMNILAGLLLFLFLFTGKGRKLERWEGGILLGLYVVYLTALIMEW
ncbi:calcium/sodium antiporter [Aquiflexum gelatinilyticum]|uniref:Calcium/sodium antiporter n=1 Tax=Aquiflexum gelatinilyticum TaxID=2961943 RepID=A0A9X2SYL5_9BACT|nr:calcium/sodium antiporter [Aquiflexum gelatinilyticum]MCR9015304.1 calcium/sodium antiporter [Aquiflexum gelatinilyticum]